MRDIFTLLVPASLALVTIILFVGIYALFRGGSFGRSWSNKLMRMRVLAQALAVLTLVAAAVWRANAH